MPPPSISGIAPFFIVKNVPAALSFYRDQLDFEITYQGPGEDDIFFGIVQRGAAMIIFKDIGVDPVPNYTRISKKGSPAGMPTCMWLIRMHWKRSFYPGCSLLQNHPGRRKRG